MGLLLVGVAGGIVLVGMGVAVAVGRLVAVGAITVAVGLPVSEGVNVGNGVGPGNVGNGVNVAPPKLNKGVGVGPPPWVGNRFGLGVPLTVSRGRSRLIVIEQRQQITNRNKAGISILPVCPCWL